MAATTLYSPLPAGLTAILLAVELAVAMVLEVQRWRRLHPPKH
jgi:hypothetical protein